MATTRAHYRRPASSGDRTAAVMALSGGVAAALTAFGGGEKERNSAPIPWSLWAVLAVATLLIAAACCYYLGTRIRRERVETKAAQDAADRQQAEDAQRLAQLKIVTPLATLLELNQTQIDEYHRIATDQADRSFRSSQRAMAIGLLIIIGCCAAGLYFQNAQVKVFVGSIAAVAAGLSAFLNRTYLQMYGQTLSQLNRYFEQPVLTGYYLTAERLAQDLKDDPESEMRRRIIDQVLQASARMNGTAETAEPEPDQPPAMPRRMRRRRK
ncbi:hypothetical protein ABT143_17320 [Streptomyces sp. NPDC002033]|uniref:TRADD-N-associated membrane domain-containing protein n=1 Tax=unclassified Streptomyces TaxID=2593676 RepID=UPI0033210909